MYPPANPPVAPPTNQRARNSLVAGLIGWGLWVLLFCFNFTLGPILSVLSGGLLAICFAIAGFLPIIPWIVAVVTGHQGLSQTSQTGEGGRGQAIAGLIMGYLGVALTVCTLLAFLLALIGLVTIPQIPGVLPTPPSF